jgi:amidohydrolase
MYESIERLIIKDACDLVDSMKNELLEISKYIFSNPELAYKEYKAVKCLENFISTYGFEVKHGEGELFTAIKGTRPPRKGINIAFISEYDALQIGHACGHNLIAATGAGAAVVFDKIAERHSLTANSIFLGTPAEEGGGGKIKMIEKGFFNGIDYAMMIHPADRTMVEDWSLAGQKVNIRYYGKPAHCAASPWLGANALAAAEQTMSMVNAWRCQFKDYSRVHGIIVKGGEATNVIPDYAEIQYNVRSDQREYMDELMNIVLNCAYCAAKAFCVEVKYDFSLAYEPIKNSPVIERYMKKSFEMLGETVMPRMKTHGIGSTDMGNVSQHIPAIHGHLKLADANTHTYEFMEAAGGKAGEKYVITGTKAMVMTAIGLALHDFNKG